MISLNRNSELQQLADDLAVFAGNISSTLKKGIIKVGGIIYEHDFQSYDSIPKSFFELFKRLAGADSKRLTTDFRMLDGYFKAFLPEEQQFAKDLLEL
ncbi:MAG: hypothetical protein GY750_14025 [Lentisphaerae bacterium]|nr:hypothetical protein [Lentisphaerota bacterium]MCP4102518.1 hypothetical protein [Lentisphaerota bacterium]